MSSHSSNNSNADMELINADDLEDNSEDVIAAEDMKDSLEAKERVTVDSILRFIATY